MDSLQQKSVLAFLRVVEKWRKEDKAMEAAAKKKEPADVRKHQNNIQLHKMHIDRELDDMIKICKAEQLKLDL